MLFRAFSLIVSAFLTFTFQSLPWSMSVNLMTSLRSLFYLSIPLWMNIMIVMIIMS